MIDLKLLYTIMLLAFPNFLPLYFLDIMFMLHNLAENNHDRNEIELL